MITPTSADTMKIFIFPLLHMVLTIRGVHLHDTPPLLSHDLHEEEKTRLSIMAARIIFSNRPTSVGSGFVKALFNIKRLYGVELSLLGVQYTLSGYLHDVQVGVTGNINPGEPPIGAAIREVCEETGIILTPFHLMHVYDGWSDSTHRKMVRTYIVNLDEPPEPSDPAIIPRRIGSNPPLRDDRIDHIQVVIVGKPETVTTVTATSSATTVSSDYIGALVVVPFGTIIQDGVLNWRVYNGETTSHEVVALADPVKVR